MKSQDVKKLNMPTGAGVYFWKREPSPSRRGGAAKPPGEVLYIGKATNLRDRVSSYFAKDLIDTRGPGILDMTVQATTIEWQETDSVLEALILEANLIKKYQPKYNVKEKDNKSFNCVAITNDPWPKVIIIREREIKTSSFKKIFGPFPNGSSLRDALKIIRKIFPFFDEASVKKDQQEFYRQLGLTPSGMRNEYLKNINNIRLFFEGKKKKIITSLEKEMKAHSKKQEFELAEIAKRKIFALNHINDVALIKNDFISHRDDFRIEAYDVAHISGTGTVGVMTVMMGSHADKAEYRKFKIRSSKGNDDYGNLKELLTRRFKHAEWRMPDMMVIDGGIGQYAVAQEVLKQFRLNIKMVSVIKDERHKPKAIHGDEKIIKKYKREILLANSEAHRFAITFHKEKRNKSFLQK